jgi:hypothetical protein
MVDSPARLGHYVVTLCKGREPGNEGNGFDAAVAFLEPTDYVGLLYAYFDESYNPPNPKTPNDVPVYTVACYLSPVWKWKRLTQKWSKAISDAGLAGIGFHMNRYENRIQEYADWDNDKRVRVLKSLHKIIDDETIYSTAFVMDRVAWDEVVTDDLRQVFHTKSPYACNAFSCMSEINQWCNRKNYEGPIQYVFAHLDRQGGQLDEFFGIALRSA